MKRRRNRRRGFTLMEVLLVLAILVVLGSMVTVGYLQIQKNANKDAARTQISMLEDAVQLYALQVGTCPSTQQRTGSTARRSVRPPEPGKVGRTVPARSALPNDPWGSPYQYEALSAEEFRIWSNGPDGQQGNEDDINPALERQQNSAGGQ